MVRVMFEMAAIFSLANVVLLLVLVAIYGNSFRRIRAEFTFGMLFFAAMFLFQNLMTLYSYLAMFMYFASNVDQLVLSVTLVQTLGLMALLWISLR